MCKEENARALETVAALLPLDSPERRQAEVDAFLAWQKVSKKQSRELGSGWWTRETPHKDLIMRRICRIDPKQARSLISTKSWRDPCLKRVWVETLLEDWQEGDGKTLEVLLRGYSRSHVREAMPLLLEKLPTFSEQDRRLLAPTLVRVLCNSWGFVQKPENMAALLVGLGTAISVAHERTWRVVNVLFCIEEKELPVWSRGIRRYVRQHCPNPAPALAELFLLIRKMAASVAFENRYRYRRPRKKVTRRFLARWRRLEAALSWIESFPTYRLREHFGKLREKRMKETPLWLLAGSPDVIQPQSI